MVTVEEYLFVAIRVGHSIDPLLHRVRSGSKVSYDTSYPRIAVSPRHDKFTSGKRRIKVAKQDRPRVILEGVIVWDLFKRYSLDVFRDVRLFETNGSTDIKSKMLQRSPHGGRTRFLKTNTEYLLTVQEPAPTD
jgi:hypothetical protein